MTWYEMFERWLSMYPFCMSDVANRYITDERMIDHVWAISGSIGEMASPVIREYVNSLQAVIDAQFIHGEAGYVVCDITLNDIDMYLVTHRRHGTIQFSGFIRPAECEDYVEVMNQFE